MYTLPFRCPHCGSKSGGTGNAHLYGSPFCVCDKCKQEYVDRRYHEIAIDGIRNKDINLTSERIDADRKKAIIAIIVGIGFLILHYIIAVNSSGSFFFSLFTILGAILVVAGIDILMDGSKRMIEKNRVILDEERQASIRRMQDPSYVQKLRSIGYSLKCPNCSKELDRYQNNCSSCGHSITPASDVISLTPNRFTPNARKTILVALALAIIAFVSINSYNINSNNGKYTRTGSQIEYRGTLSSFISQYRTEFRSFVYQGEVDDYEINGITCKDYRLEHECALADIADDNTTVYKEGLVQEYIRYDEPYDRFVKYVFCITDLDSGHKYYFSSLYDAMDWIENNT